MFSARRASEVGVGKREEEETMWRLVIFSH